MLCFNCCKKKCKQGCKHGEVLAVNENLCNCSDGVQMLHAETVGCIGWSCGAHKPQGVDTQSSSTFLRLSLHILQTSQHPFTRLWRCIAFIRQRVILTSSLRCENKVCVNDHSVLTGAENTARPLITVSVTSAVLKKSKSQSPPVLHLSWTSSLHQLHHPQCQRTSTADN